MDKNKQIDIFEQELRAIFKDKSIYQISVWTRDHAQYLKWHCNYNASKIEEVMQEFLTVGFFLNENFRDNEEAISDFRELGIKTVKILERACR